MHLDAVKCDNYILLMIYFLKLVKLFPLPLKSRRFFAICFVVMVATFYQNTTVKEKNL